MTRILTFSAFVLAIGIPAGCSASADKAGTATPAPTPAASAPAAPAKQAEAKPADVKFTDLDGKSFGLADVQGKVKVVNFWATWCVPCIKEIPGFNSVYGKYKDRDVAFVGISVDDGGAADVKPFLAKGKVKIDYRVATAALGDLGGLGVSDSIPVTLVYDKNGTLVKRFDQYTEEKDLVAAIEEALKASA